ncbi:MAG: hypothetical protein VXZ96_07555 [Myxococcota bacterium]|nr:hypothetical protein [Myxococcota bacterium]MEC8380159.1 hypothetical protein [Myxococcota bacterium]
MDLSVINSVLSGGLLLVMLSYAYLLYSALWKAVLRREAQAYFELKEMSLPSGETEYWRPILKYRCSQNGEPVDLVIKGGCLGLRVEVHPDRTGG